MPNIIKRLYLEFKGSRKLGNDLPKLTLALNPLVTVRYLINTFTPITVFQTCIFVAAIIFSLAIVPIPAWAEVLIVFGFIFVLLIPITSQFFRYALPVLGWVFLFFSSQYIPLSLRRPITVTVLPAVETIFFGDNLSRILASYTCTFLDIFAWLPYGLIHFSLPFIVAALIWLFGPPTSLRCFAWSFGCMNFLGVVIQDLLFPAAAPWYKVLHGLEKANYSMKGSPGGLGRIDTLLGFDMYTSTFTNSPLIFGAMPSLHSACATMNCLWLCYLFPSLRPLWCGYVLWLWYSTMYLTHHYFIDLVVGSCLSVTFFGIVKISGRLPICDRFCRWSYTSLHFHDPIASDPLRPESGDVFALGPLDNSSAVDAFVIDDDDDGYDNDNGLEYNHLNSDETVPLTATSEPTATAQSRSQANTKREKLATA